MQDNGYDVDALAPIAEDWALFASAAMLGVASGSPLFKLLRISYYSGVLTMMGKMHTLAEGDGTQHTQAIASAVYHWVQELEDFGRVEATDINVDNLITQCSLGPPAGVKQH